MHIDLPEETKALRDELRAYLTTIMTPELAEELRHLDAGAGGEEHAKALEKIAADGWLGMGWPKEFGGQGRSAIDQYVFFEEFQRVGFPFPILTICSVAPAIMTFGNDEQKADYLPRILRGELEFAIGYTEPDAGTDLSGLKTTAIREGDEYVVNGQKVFTSHGESADYIWLAVRTDPEAARHKGISILIVDRRSPGITVTPIRTLGENHTSSVFLENVRVPVKQLVGQEHKGWRIATSQLNHERVAIASAGHVARLLEDVVQWAKDTQAPEGGRIIDRAWVRTALAKIKAGLDVIELQNWKQAWAIDNDRLQPAEASALKVNSSEFFVEAYRLFMEVLGEQSSIKETSPGSMLRAHAERYYRSLIVFTFGGGTNEVQRDLIAAMGLGLPRHGYGR